MSDTVELKIPMLPNIEVAATKTAQGVAEYMELSPEKAEEVSMALLEACINAAEHSKSKDRNVYIQFIVNPKKLVVEIRDKGIGFKPESIAKPDIQKKINSKRKRGWGMELMRNLMDEIEVVSDGSGTLLRMTKNK